MNRNQGAEAGQDSGNLETHESQPEVSYEILLCKAERQLISAGVPDASLDAWYLLSDTFRISRADYLWKKKSCPPVIPDCWQERLDRRCRREPLAYIVGSTEFMGLSFRVGPDVLIPRQDTETLVEWVLADEKRLDQEREAGRVPGESRALHHGPLLDLCTGSGCIGLSLARLGGFEVTLADLSEKALAVAEENGRRLGVETRLYAGDLFGALPKGERYDVIVSNPPYIESAVIETLQEEVRDYEPRMALDGQADGLYFYRRLAKEAPFWLKPGGRLYVEIGYNQGTAVRRLFTEAGFSAVELRRDLAGNDRVVRGVYWNV